MALSEERLKEMEEEMNRFEAEIEGPDQRFILGSRTFQAVQAQLKTIRAGVDTDDYNDSPATLPLSALIAPPPPPPLASNIAQGPNGQPPMQPPPPPPRPAFVPPQLRNRAPPPPRPPMPLPSRPPMPHPGMRFPGSMPGGQPQMGGPPGSQGPMPPHMGMGPPMMRPFSHPHGWSPGPQHIPGPAEIEKPKVVYSAEPVRLVPKKEKKKKQKTVEGAEATPGAEGTQPVEAPTESQGAGFDVDGEAMSGVAMATETEPSEQEAVMKKEKKDKKKKYVRTAAGTTWEDHTLADWESDDFRMFCGDLGNEVTDEHLARAFSKYPSFLKAKIVRDRRSNKSKGYGFVSFRDPGDFTRAMREMNGKYVGNRPIKLRKSTWKDRNIEIVRKKEKEKKRLGLR